MNPAQVLKNFVYKLDRDEKMLIILPLGLIFGVIIGWMFS
jgi:hypothetical protein